jgi:hypothetical protein
MAEPDWNPDTGGRSLAEILREAGIESATRASRRKRWDDPDEAGLRQRRAEAAADTSAATGYGRRRSDLDGPEPASEPIRERRQAPRVSRDLPESRERREPRPPRDDRVARPPAEERGLRETRPPRDPRDRDARDPRQPRRAPDPSTAAIPGLRPDRKPGVPGGTAPDRRDSDRRDPDRQPVERRPADRIPQRSRAPRAAEQHPMTGPIPVVRGDDIADTDLDNSPQESALAWLRFAGELVIALAVGIGLYFAATVLWENIPYLAVVLVPVAVTGLVTGVGAWRARMGREPVTPRLLAVLVLAGTLLTIVPAASVIANR